MSAATTVNPDDLRIYAGRSNPTFADKLAQYLGVPRSPARAKHFSNDVSPDAGRVHSAGRFAQRLGLPLVVGNKTRISDTQVSVSGLIGDVSGRTRAIVYDDEIASGTSIVEVVRVLAAHDIEQVWVVCTHGVFAGEALARLTALPAVQEIVMTDTVPMAPEKATAKLRILSVAPLFGEAIRRNYLRQSIGDLFTFWDEYEGEA